MTNERKAPRDWQTWADFANCYDLVLFNECVNILDGAVVQEWYESYERDEDETEDDNREVFQWYAIGVSEWDAEFLNKHFDLDIFYSDTLGIYILPVYHFGTSWDYVPLSMNKTEDND